MFYTTGGVAFGTVIFIFNRIFDISDDIELWM